ncbi:hypothetical protein FK529_00600 [Tsukamurella asaccharolytica]|uniref:Uncharacterized protein n=1 Tax=Tsukamurella asaccharolytica TaxID=2592067 RepID=A0A5C5REM6_9ACTN|nr:hypothetical protein [Tsukamurella asaccharolytica]TWS21152.1 hypothetical protein FK529_00600 [Tsukamurella asaccharolytica]
MTPTTIKVSSQVYYGLASILSTATDKIGSTLLTCATSLDGCEGMAGSDEAAADWAAGYDAQIKSLLAATALLGNATDALGFRVHQAGVNHEVTENHVAGKPAPTTPSYKDGSKCLYNDPPTALGNNGPGLQGLVDLINEIGIPVPNGHLDRLTAASAALKALGQGVRSAFTTINLMKSMGVSQWVGSGLAEGSDIIARVNGLSAAAESIANDADHLATKISEFAQEVSNVRNDILEEIEIAAITEMAFVIVASIFAVPTGGATAVGGAAAVAARTALAASKIRTLIVQAATKVRILRPSVATVGKGKIEPGLAAVRDAPVKKLEVGEGGKLKETTGFSPEKERSWQKYLKTKEEEGKTPWPQDRWSKNYDQNILNRVNGAAWEKEAGELYGYSKEAGYRAHFDPDGTGARRYDFGKPGDYVEMKSGGMDRGQMRIDEAALGQGNKVTYHLLQKPTNSELVWLESMKSKYPGAI